MQQAVNLLKISMKSILKNRMRSLLTSLGIIIGVSAVIVMVAVGEGSQKQIENEINSLGTNVIIVFPSFSKMGGVSRGAGSMNRITMDDVDELKERSTLLSGVSAIARSGGQIIGGGSNWNTSVYGVDPDYQAIRNWEMESGEFISERDVQSRKKVAILGKTVVNELYPQMDAVGEKIRIRNIPFTVIGVLRAKGQSSMGNDQDDVVLAPSTTVFYRLKGGKTIDMINASSVSVDAMDAAQEEIREILRDSHRLDEGEDDDFMLRNQAEITEAASATSRVMTLLLGAVAAVSLIVGGIGIMNIMLVSVTERTREIGLRLSVGAREKDILHQFLTEAVVLSLAGGIIGILFSLGVSLAINHWTGLLTVIQPQIVILAFTFSGAIGIFFGFYPARKAARLNPIDALRYE